MDYPYYLKKLREKAFLSQADLAKLLEVSVITVTRWETGKFEPTIRLKKKIHTLLVNFKIIEE